MSSPTQKHNILQKLHMDERAGNCDNLEASLQRLISEFLGIFINWDIKVTFRHHFKGLIVNNEEGRYEYFQLPAVPLFEYEIKINVVTDENRNEWEALSDQKKSVLKIYSDVVYNYLFQHTNLTNVNFDTGCWKPIQDDDGNIKLTYDKDLFCAYVIGDQISNAAAEAAQENTIVINDTPNVNTTPYYSTIEMYQFFHRPNGKGTWDLFGRKNLEKMELLCDNIYQFMQNAAHEVFDSAEMEIDEEVFDPPFKHLCAPGDKGYRDGDEIDWTEERTKIYKIRARIALLSKEYTSLILPRLYLKF